MYGSIKSPQFIIFAITVCFCYTVNFNLGYKMKFLWCVLMGLLASSAWANDALPKPLLEGYWAMDTPVWGEHILIDFRQTDTGLVSNHYRFECRSDGLFRQLDSSQAKLVVNGKQIWLYETRHQQPTSQLSILALEPQESLILQQDLTDEFSALKAHFPEGLLFTYTYTSILQPVCQSANP